MEDDQPTPAEPDFLDYLDGLDEIDPYEDEEKFEPFFSGDWVKIVAAIIAISMFALAAYSGLRIVFHW